VIPILTADSYTICTDAFNEDIKPAIPQCIEMLKNPDRDVRSSGQDLLSDLMQEGDL